VAQVRLLSSDDWRIWRDVRLSALAEAPTAFGATLSDWESSDEARWRGRLEDVPFNVIAMLGDDVVGQASGTTLAEDGRVELISMWVAPHARGTETADTLVEAVVGWATENGAVAVRVSVRRANERAIRFYERNGFTAVDEPGDEPEELAMVRPIT
jgi:ribosomal protein S18 acetylase RimI-like enzyme